MFLIVCSLAKGCQVFEEGARDREREREWTKLGHTDNS